MDSLNACYRRAVFKTTVRAVRERHGELKSSVSLVYQIRGGPQGVVLIARCLVAVRQNLKARPCECWRKVLMRFLRAKRVCLREFFASR